MNSIKEKEILILAPSLIAESLSLKLTSLENNLKINLDTTNQNFYPDLIIWNVLNYQSEDLIRLELIKLKERWEEAKFLIIFSNESINSNTLIPNINSEGLLVNPSVEKVLESINTIINGGRVFDVDRKPLLKSKEKKELSFSQKILSSGLKQIDNEINHIFSYLRNESTADIYKFILKGRLRELITAKSLLIFLWGNTLEIYSEDNIFNNSESNPYYDDETIFIKEKDSQEVWNLILNRLIKKYDSMNLNLGFSNPTIILNGLKKEIISKLIFNSLRELDNLIKNVKENYQDTSYEEELDSLIKELRKKTISNITDDYLRVKRNLESVSINEFIRNTFNSEDIDSESHHSLVFLKPIINNQPLNYDGKLYPLYETESFKIIESIISNWTIRTCNILASEIFNYCSDWPELRTLLINPDLQSTRSFERFRNNINNYNRWHNNVYMPIYLYESKREYLDIVDSKFIRYFKNENREKDLDKLEWLQRQVTLLVEIRDALAPQLEIAVKYIGKLFVTILTKIIGKAIGLIGKGILQGLGRSNSK